MLPAPAERGWHERWAEESETGKHWMATRWHLDRLILDDPRRGLLYLRRSRVLARLEQPREAAADLTSAMERGLDDPSIRVERGLLLQKLGKWSEAARDYADAVEREPINAGHHSLHGNALAELGRLPEAERAFEKAIRHEPRALVSWYQRAVVQLALGQVDAYRSTCAGMMERFGKVEDQQVTTWLASTCILAEGAVKDLTPLRKRMEKLLSSAREPNEEWLAIQAALLLRMRQWPQVIDTLTAKSAPSSDSAVPTVRRLYNWYILALAHQHLGNTQKANEYRQKAVEGTQRLRKQHEKESTAGAPAWNQRLTLELLGRELETLTRMHET
jgi:tetratricopeptide (TPR) repeat protein